MSVLIGKKIGMTEVFTDNGRLCPGHCDSCGALCSGFEDELKRKMDTKALMLAYGTRKAKHTNKPLQGFYDKVKAEPAQNSSGIPGSGCW